MKRLLLASAMSFGLALPAAADTFTYDGFSVNGGVQIDVLQPKAETVIAGQIQLNGATGSPNQGQTLLVWCLDLLNNLQTGPYTYQIDPLTIAGAGNGNPTLTTTQITEIGDLMKFGNSGGDNDLAATQLAIWKIEYGANFQTLGVSAAITSDENAQLLSVLAGGSNFDPNVQVNLLHDAVTAPNQALGYAVSPVPLPAAVWLFGGVLAVAGAFGRFMRRQERVGVLA